MLKIRVRVSFPQKSVKKPWLNFSVLPKKFLNKKIKP